MIKKSLTLGYNKPSEGYVVDKACGQITVSVVFRPVPSVSKSGKWRFLLFIHQIKTNSSICCLAFLLLTLVT